MATNKEVQELEKEIHRQNQNITKLINMLSDSAHYEKKYQEAEKEINKLNNHINKLFKHIN